MATTTSIIKRFVPMTAVLFGCLCTLMWLTTEHSKCEPVVHPTHNTYQNMTISPHSITNTKAIKDCPPSAPPVAVNSTCGFDFRQQHVRRMCGRLKRARVNPRLANAKLMHIGKPLGPGLGAVVLDYERKTIGCIIPEVSSSLWVTYMQNHTKKEHLTADELSAIPLDEIIHGKFASWTKFIVVKHPMQRLISAYYEIVTKRNLFNNMSLETFATYLAYGEIYELNSHWVLYTSWCFPCSVKYHYILKTETMDSDLPLFNKAVGHTLYDENLNTSVNSTANVLKKNPTQKYEYDQQLKDLSCKRPDVVRKLMELYDKDLQLFGYNWNPTTLSTCAYGKQCC